MPYLNRLSNLSTLGLAGDTMYDTLTTIGGGSFGTVNVNSITFNVTCGKLPNAVATAASANGTGTQSYTINSQYDKYNFNFTMSSLRELPNALFGQKLTVTSRYKWLAHIISP